jgi:hypothetical protein
MSRNVQPQTAITPTKRGVLVQVCNRFALPLRIRRLYQPADRPLYALCGPLGTGPFDPYSPTPSSPSGGRYTVSSAYASLSIASTFRRSSGLSLKTVRACSTV